MGRKEHSMTIMDDIRGHVARIQELARDGEKAAAMAELAAMRQRMIELGGYSSEGAALAGMMAEQMAALIDEADRMRASEADISRTLQELDAIRPPS